MRIPSGVTDQVIYFVAVDSTDFTTRETGLSSFTVYRSRNGGAAAAFTTPTVTEVDATNMPGVYKLLLDEDMTIDSGDDAQEYVVHITHAGMAPVTRVFELWRREVTAGGTLTVAAGVGQASVQSIVANAITATAIASNAITSAKIAASAIGASQIASDAITAAKIAADAIGASELATDAVNEIVAAVWAAATRTLSANTNLNDLSAAGVRAAVGLAAADLDTQLAAILTDTGTTLDGKLDAIAAYIDTEVAAILALLDDPRAEPGQGAPPVNPDLATKIDYLYKAWRNKKEQTASEHRLFADDGSTIDQKATVSDDGSTTTVGEMATGA